MKKDQELAYVVDLLRERCWTEAADAIEAQAKHIRVLREALWVMAEHDELHFGKKHSTVIQARSALEETK